MSKKHFIALADFIKTCPDLNKPEVIQALAEFCGEQNYNFDHNRFVNYVAGECGPNGGTVKA